ncbi:hypothetical protein JCM33774_18670 [Actinophytocola sp. KF-1]
MSTNQSETGGLGVAGELVAALQSLHVQAGKPSMRSIATAVGDVSHTTVSEAINGKRIPSWPIVRSIVRYLNGDEESFHQLWVAANVDPAAADVERRRDQEFFDLYRQQVATFYSVHRSLFQMSRQLVPIEDVFVAPTIRTAGRDSRPLTLAEFERKIRRTALIGTAGSGKSLTSSFLVYWMAKRERGSAPFMVSLRNIAHGSYSLVSAIEQQMGRFLQEPAPVGAVSRVLREGDSLVVFDGLDEVDIRYRRDVAAAIEMFSVEFPNVRILVTSRRHSYETIRLDPSRFSVYEIEDFNEAQVRDYVGRWFRLAQQEHSEENAVEQAQAFLNETERIADLRATPLLLALTCEQFYGVGAVRHNLPDVYEEYFSLIFDRWDRVRGVETEANVHRSARHALEYVAFWMLNERSAAASATASKIIQVIRDYVSERGFDYEDVEQEPGRLFETFRGRMQLLVEVGSTSSGEPMYAFAHRSFLEFLAASYLSRAARSSERLGALLASRVVRQEWAMVGQLAIAIFDRMYMDGAKEVLSVLLDTLERLNGIERLNLRRFLSESVEYVELPVEFARHLSKVGVEGTEVAGQDSPMSEVGYPGAVACHIAGITPRQLDYWARTGLVVPSLRTTDRQQRLYSFHDLLVLKVIKRLLDTGVSLQNIRIAVDHLRRRGIGELAKITLFSDGTTVYEASSPEEIVDLLQGGQGVFGIAVSGALQEINAMIHEFPAQHADGTPANASDVRQAFNASTA